jgi:glycosyltransferase involved in cell wall biosynthesis
MDKSTLIKSNPDQQYRPLVSIITVVFNNSDYIRDAIESVVSQSYPLIEYIVIDGGSTDGTIEVIKEYQDKISVFISEIDNGIYDALNKGITHASGDVVAILHSDDQFCDANVVSNMVLHMSQTDSEFCFSDLVHVDSLSGKVSRYYMANFFKQWMFRIGWMPPHPTCFIKRSLFDEFGMYSTDYKIAGDFDLLVRFFYGRKIRWSYLDQITVKMSPGGTSNSGWQSNRIIFNEISRSLKSNGIWSLPVFQLARYALRLMELIIKPKKGSYD